MFLIGGMFLDKTVSRMRTVNKPVFKALCLVLVLTLNTPFFAQAALAIRPELCPLKLSSLEQREVLDQLFSETYERLTSKAEKTAYALMKTHYQKKILERCNGRCSEADLMQITKEVLGPFVHHLDSADHYLHILTGWTIVVSVAIAISLSTHFVGAHPNTTMGTLASMGAGFAAGAFFNLVVALKAAKASKIVRRVSIGKPLFEESAVHHYLDSRVNIQVASQDAYQTTQVSRIVQIASFAASRAEKATDIILSPDSPQTPERIGRSLGAVAVLVHKYFEELSPQERETLFPEDRDDVYTMVHGLFTDLLPDSWQSKEKKLELFNNILNMAKTYDILYKTENQKNNDAFYTTLIKGWLDI